MPSFSGEMKRVTLENIHIVIPDYIKGQQRVITSYEDMVNIVLELMKQGNFFGMDKNILRECLIDLTYMYCPGDDVNKDRILCVLDPDDEGSSDEDDDDDIIELPTVSRNNGNDSVE